MDYISPFHSDLTVRQVRHPSSCPSSKYVHPTEDGSYSTCLMIWYPERICKVLPNTTQHGKFDTKTKHVVEKKYPRGRPLCSCYEGFVYSRFMFKGPTF